MATSKSIEADSTAIRQILQQFQRAEDKWNRGDLGGVMAYIADNVVQMPPNGPAIIGKKSLQAEWTQFLEQNNNNWHPSIEDIQVSGNLAYIRGKSKEITTPKVGGETTTNVYKAVWIYRRNDKGSWELVLEIWNSLEPDN
ncbi:MAG: DUF4440 domain-containing protein [Anaerolineae bacterium]|nr:DUF4440 domain-containing protein [Anaerolineae bacterium]